MNAPLLPVLPGYADPQLIAHGTTALVFRATQTRLNRLVAIKVITADTGSIPVNAARELATTVALSSQPHIVSIIDTGVTDDDRPYIVMEYCEGGSYAQILRQGGLLPVDDVLEVGVKIGEALHAAHQAGIVHRDVKPSNILRSRFGPALTDFGIARAPEELGGTLTREMMTPHHASPEALLHQAQSGISDIYSLSSTLWTLLIGHPPFVDPTKPPLDMYAFRDRVLNEPLPPMTREDVPAWLVRELDRAMAKLPASRHRTALEFAEALRRGALGLSPSPAPAPVVVIAPPQRQPAVGGPVGAAAPRYPWGTEPLPEPASGPLYIPSARPRDDAADLLAKPPTGPDVEPAADRVAVGGPPSWSPAPDVPAPHAFAPPDVPAPHVLDAPPRTGPAPAAEASPGTGSGRGLSDAASSAAAAASGAPFRPPLSEPGTADAPPVDTWPPVRSEARPEARPDDDLDADPEGDDEGGWLGPAARYQPPADPTGLAEPRPARRFDNLDLLAPSTRQRGTLLAVLIGVAVLATVAAVVLAFTSPDGSPPVGDGVSPSPTQFISAQASGQPRDIRITEDRGSTVTLSWTDPTAGTVTFVVIGTGPDGERLETKSIRRGTHSATYSGLSPTKNYCFVVGAVYGVDTLALGQNVCTKR